jgi:hypothetical protein
MSSICFTGRGNDSSGNFITRDVWERQANAAGFSVHDKVYPHTDYLVASRSDTSKAAAARRNGTTVLSYAQFEQLMAKGIVQVRPTASDAPPPDPAVLKRALEEAEQTIDGWGMF